MLNEGGARLAAACLPACVSGLALVLHEAAGCCDRHRGGSSVHHGRGSRPLLAPAGVGAALPWEVLGRDVSEGRPQAA
eukprot:153101-Pyramimonas_sp.AAC.1